MNFIEILEGKSLFNKTYQKLLELIKKPNKIYISECANNICKLYASGIFQKTKQNIIYVTSSIYEASRAYEILCEISGTDNVSFFPVEELISSELVATSEAFRLARMMTLYNIVNNIPQIIVTNTEGITRQLMSKEKLKDATIKINTNDIYDRNLLIEDLIIRGYKKATITSTRGTFSVRGGLIDVFPVNENNAYRINFFDNEIENIKKINLETQMSEGCIDALNIYPLYEVYYKENEIFKIKEQIIKDKGLNEKTQFALESIENYQNLEQLYMYLPYLTPKYQPFINLIENPICIYEDYNACLEHEKAIFEEITEYFLDKKTIINNDFFLTLKDINNQNNPVIYTSIFNSNIKDTYLDYHFNIETSNTFEYNNFKTMLDDIKINHQKTYLITHIDDKKLNFIEETFKTNQIEYQKITSLKQISTPKVYIGVSENAFGFIDLNQNFELISPNEFAPGKIVKNSKYQKFLKDSVKISSKEELKPGDYVVHQDYGIGRYIGIKSREIRNTINDYLCIEYAKESSLYIPVENIYVLEKYIGSKDKLPKLNSLNSNDWQKKKEKIKEKTREIAKQLIKIQAQRDAKQGYIYKEDSTEQMEFENDFMYTVTADQQKAIDQVKQDMESTRPVDRLICGDVGFGKTEVAMRAAFKAVDNNKQVAYLAPTTVLTRQHYYTFKERFEKYGIRVELLNRFVPIAKQNEIIKGLKNGYVDIVIGTHRILSNDINFKDLGLLIIDEEQRFGVEHKEKIKNIKSMVDVITLSATPIPRTLQMALSGIRDLSLIETAPNNRLPIQTYVLESNDSVIREAINREMGRNGQVFYLLNRISELDTIRKKVQKLVPKAKIGVIHGKMDKEQIEDQLVDFLDRKYDVLICTTIIETGIDIPNANTLIIERSDILGLSQLYQIRGRVGRSDRISYAYLMYDKNKIITANATKRLEAIKEFTELGSGYKIAMRDLAIRGSGDILGSEQSGYIDAIGMDLYMKLLNEAIKEEKGEEKEEPNIRKYHLDISRHVDEKYVDADSIRIEIHQSINKIKSREQINALVAEYTDRYGKLPEDILLYMEEKYLEYLLKINGVESLKETQKEIIIHFDEQTSQKINLQKLFELSLDLYLRYRFDYKNKKIIIKIDNNPTTSYIFGLTKYLERIKDIKKV